MRIHLSVDGQVACGAKARVVSENLALVDCQRCYGSTRAARIFFRNFDHFNGTDAPLDKVAVARDGTVTVREPS